MTWKKFLKNESFVGGVLETISRNTKIPVIHRGRIRKMSIDNIGLRIEMAPVVQQQPDGTWKNVEESTCFHLDHASLLPLGEKVFPPSQNNKWTIVHPGNGCVVVMSPVRPNADGVPPLREVCQFIIFYPPRLGSMFERETFENLDSALVC